MKLYKVTLQNDMKDLTRNHYKGIAYVVAESPDKAYQKVKTLLDKENYGYDWERQLKTIELIADEKFWANDTGYVLYL